MQNIDAVIYTPLEEEFEQLRRRFPPETDINGDFYTGFLSRGRDGENVAVVVGLEWGNDHAYNVMREFILRYHPNIAVCVGIGGGLTKDAKLGDIFYSSHVFDLTQRLKYEKDDKGILRTKYDPECYDSSPHLKKALDRSRLSSAGISPYKKWVRACELLNEVLLMGQNTTALGHPSSYFKSPTARPGKIAATNAVLADETAVEDVRACGRKMACVDTESAGFARACREQKLHRHIVIRGVSDMADCTKKITEGAFQNLFRKIAASNAAVFLVENLSSMLTEELRAPIAEGRASPTNIDVAREAIEANERIIREELRRRSVVFRTIEQDFRMPVPRVRKQHDVVEPRKKVPIEQEIEDAVERYDRILLRLPKHYPDAALPWLFAHLLTEPSDGGRYPIPVCIQWSEFGPPQNTLDAHLEDKGLSFAKNNPSYRLIFIVTDALTAHKSKPQFLNKSFSGFLDAKIIIFQDTNEINNLEDELVNFFQPEVFFVEGISFSSITNYIKANFGMPMDESEVLAKRLVSTFNMYRLKVHPTYLASIQRDTVLSFIEANQRGELIELAVAGLLSLLIADDKSQVVLRRGTRERFLSRLAVDIYSEKQKYDEGALVAYVSGYAKEMGFDIEPQEFIKSFVESGILAYDDNLIKISVPVIRSYMLAKGLAAQGSKGLKYFSFDDDVFDGSTFDLYCEFCDDKEIYSTMSRLLDESISFLTKKISLYPDLVQDGQFHTDLLSKSLNLAKVHKDLSKKAAELIEVTNLVSEKQAQLDIQLQITQSRAAKSVDFSDESKFKDERSAVLRFYAAAIMLGSAAEKMNDSFKLSLISKVLTLGSAVSTDLLTIFSRFQVRSTVAEVLSQIENDGTVKFETEDSKKEFGEFVKLNVEVWQFSRAAHPLLVLLTSLCEAGRTNVLLSPIIRTRIENDKVAEFFRTVWAFDIDPISQRQSPKALSKRLGRSPFLRTIFGLLMVNRSYWYHHGRLRREAVAKGIDEMLLPHALKADLRTDETEPPVSL